MGNVPTPPVQRPTPGAGTSFNPDVIDQLALNNHLFLEEWAKYNAIVNFLNRLKGWKDTAQRAQENGLPIPAPPVAPAGYVLPPTPPPAPALAIPITVGPYMDHANGHDRYQALGDLMVPFLGGVGKTADGRDLILKQRNTPWGISQWWETVA